MKTILAFLLLVGFAMAQNVPIPHPYVVGGISLNGGGYQTVSETVGAGFDIESTHLIGDVEGTYDNARKVNDGTMNNKNGHVRYAQARLFGRFSNGYFLGGGWQWTQTSTTNYSKQAWSPTIGGGRDFLSDTVAYSLRVQALYRGKGSDKINGVQGVEVGLTYPSPATKGHFFLKEILTVDVFHGTVQPNDTPAQVAALTSSKSATSYLTTGILVRW